MVPPKRFGQAQSQRTRSSLSDDGRKAPMTIPEATRFNCTHDFVLWIPARSFLGVGVSKRIPGHENCARIDMGVLRALSIEAQLTVRLFCLQLAGSPDCGTPVGTE
jgi:hypothetical protein